VNNLYRTTWPRRKNLATVCYSRSHSPIQTVGTCSLSLNLAATTPCITQSPPRRARRRAEVSCRACRRVICHRGERTDVLAGGLAALVAVSRGPCHARSCFFRRAFPGEPFFFIFFCASCYHFYPSPANRTSAYTYARYNMADIEPCNAQPLDAWPTSHGWSQPKAD
jgi:hypothetical protein